MEDRNYTKKEIKMIYWQMKEAVHDCNKEKIDTIVAEHPDVFSFSQPDGEILMHALIDIYRVDPEIICYVIDKGADPNQIGSMLKVPAFCRAITVSILPELAAAMVKKIKTFDLSDFYYNPMFYAIRFHNLEVVKELLNKDFDLTPAYENPCFDQTQNALSYVKLYEAFYKNTYYEEEYKQIREYIEEAVIKKGLILSQRPVSKEVKAQDLSELDIWMMEEEMKQAIWNKKSNEMLVYFAKQCQPILKTTFKYGSVMHQACEYGTLEQVKLLVEAGADYNQVHKTLLVEMPPIGYAISEDKPEIVKYLLEQRPEIATEDSEGRLLEIAIRFGEEKALECVKLLVEAGAPIEVYYEYEGYTHSSNPISLAERSQKQDIAAYLSQVTKEKNIVLTDYPLSQPDEEEISRYKANVNAYKKMKKEGQLTSRDEKGVKLKAKYAAFSLKLRAALKVALENAAQKYMAEKPYQLTLAFLNEGENSYFWTVLHTEEGYEDYKEQHKAADDQYRYFVEEHGEWDIAQDAFDLMNAELSKFNTEADDFFEQIEEMSLQCLEAIQEEELLGSLGLSNMLINFYVREHYEAEQMLAIAKRLNKNEALLKDFKNCLELLCLVNL